MFFNSLFLNVVEIHIVRFIQPWLSHPIKHYVLGGSNSAFNDEGGVFQIS
jgi:hypothetical protein